MRISTTIGLIFKFKHWLGSHLILREGIKFGINLINHFTHYICQKTHQKLIEADQSFRIIL